MVGGRYALKVYRVICCLKCPNIMRMCDMGKTMCIERLGMTFCGQCVCAGWLNCKAFWCYEKGNQCLIPVCEMF